MENPALNNRLRLHWAIFLNVPPEWPELRVQRVLEPYFIPEQWFLYDRFIDWLEDDPYARTQRKLERLMFTIVRINKVIIFFGSLTFSELFRADTKRGEQSCAGWPFSRCSLCTWWLAQAMNKVLISLLQYDSGFIKSAHRTYNKLVYNSAVKPCTLLGKIVGWSHIKVKISNLFFQDNKQTAVLKEYNLLILRESVNKIWHQLSSEVLFFLFWTTINVELTQTKTVHWVSV